MSDEPDNQEASGTRRPPPSSFARPGVAPPTPPAASKRPPPPPFAPPPKPPGASASSAATPANRPAAPPVGAVPRAGGPASLTPPKPAAGAVPRPVDRSSPATPKAPAAEPVASPIAASRAARASSSPDALRRGGVSLRPVSPASYDPMGLPPPPEFLPIGLEPEADAELAAVTLPGIPPALLGERASEAVEVERDHSGRSIVEPLPLPPPLGAPVHARPVAEELRAPPVTAPAAAAPVDDGDGDGDDDPPDHAPHAAAAGEAAAADDDLDIDVSEDTLPRVALVREAYPPLPPAATQAPSQVPTAPVPVVPPRASPRPRATTGQALAAMSPVPPRRPLALWIGVGAGVGAVISIVVLWWLTASSPEKEATREPAADVGTATPPTEAKAAPEPAPPRPAEAKTEVVVPPAPEAKAAGAPEPTPVTPTPAEPAPAEPAPAEPEPDDDASIITVERDDSEYRRAVAEYRDTGSQKSLLAMAIAACELGHGPRARAAFRKLVGKPLRSQAMAACQEAKVDVTSSVEGWTGPELLAQARAALEAGDAQAAFDKAHASNKVERSSEAVLVKGLAACKLGDGEQAQRLLPHVAVKSRPRLVEGCREAGVELKE